MKKLLVLLGSIGLTATTGVSVVACTNKNDDFQRPNIDASLNHFEVAVGKNITLTIKNWKKIKQEDKDNLRIDYDSEMLQINSPMINGSISFTALKSVSETEIIVSIPGWKEKKFKVKINPAKLDKVVKTIVLDGQIFNTLQSVLYQVLFNASMSLSLNDVEISDFNPASWGQDGWMILLAKDTSKLVGSVQIAIKGWTKNLSESRWRLINGNTANTKETVLDIILSDFAKDQNINKDDLYNEIEVNFNPSTQNRYGWITVNAKKDSLKLVGFTFVDIFPINA